MRRTGISRPPESLSRSRPAMTSRSFTRFAGPPSASSLRQWAAVRIFVGATATPPQNCPERVSPNRSRLDSATTQGLSATGAGCPPTMMLSATAAEGAARGSTAVAAVRASAPVRARTTGRGMEAPDTEATNRFTQRDPDSPCPAPETRRRARIPWGFRALGR